MIYTLKKDTMNYYKGKNVLVTGGTGFVGRHLVTKLTDLKANVFVTIREEIDLINMKDVLDLFKSRFDYVFHLAGRTGGVGFNETHHADQLFNNTVPGFNVIEAAVRNGVENIFILSSTCVYGPDNMLAGKYPEIPLNEGFRGKPHSSVYGYAMAKRAVEALAYAYSKKSRVVVSRACNMYGPGDNFEPDYAHVIPALIRKMYDNPNVLKVWGTGEAIRQFMHVSDSTEAVLLLAHKLPSGSVANIGNEAGIISIGDLARMIADIYGYTGRLEYDNRKPEGPSQKVAAIPSLKQLGWSPHYSLETGIANTIEYFRGK